MEHQLQRILLIEDDPAIAESLAEALREEGYQVAWRNRGEAGLAYVETSHPHLVILDVRLPDGSGFDVCRAMRQRGLKQPILMLTARRDEVDKVLGLEMGADDYMTKPFGLRELFARVRALLRRSYGELTGANGSTHEIQAGDLTIDLESAEVRRGPKTLHLTPTEYRLLVCLARHPGQAMTRGQLLDAVWGTAAGVESERTVNVNIRRLREKIEHDPSQPALILTVPGIGYRLAKEKSA